MRLPAALAVLAIAAPLASCGTRPTISEKAMVRGRDAVALGERAEKLAMWLEGDFAADDGRELHVRRMPDFGRALHVVEIDPRDGAGPSCNAAWIVVAEGAGDIEVQQWRITRPERYAGAWKDDARLKELTMYDLRRIEGGAAPARPSAGSESFEFEAPAAMSVKVDATGIEILRGGEPVVYRRISELRDLRPTP